ncbi:MAG: flagellar filament capping protein FliD [Tepidisphaeraceae bacterium]
MGTITTGVGLISGINSKDLIDQLMAIEAKPKNDLNARIKTETDKKTALTDLQVRLTSLRLFGTTVKKTQNFRAAKATSSDEGVLTATAAIGATAGSYRMSVARLVTSQQAVSAGFEDVDTAKVGAGTFTVELGGGELNTENKLSDLNGGDGVRRGQFRITDRGGNSAIIDTTDALTLNDVVKKINSNLDVRIHAEISGDKLKLTDTSGRTNNNLIVEDVADGHAAEDLGIVKTTASNSITGTRIQLIKFSTSLSKLNDGRGVAFNTDATKPDFKVKTTDGTETDISLAGVKTVKEFVEAVQTQSNGKFYAGITSDGKSLYIHDSTYDADPDNDPDTPPPPSDLVLTALNDSTALADLGLDQTDGSGNVTGRAVMAGLGTTLLGSLNGGKGIDLGTFRIKSRNGSTADVNLAGAQTVQDVIDRINKTGLNVTAQLKAGGNGIEITDTTNSTGRLTISEVSGTSAADLGIVGSFQLGESARGKNLQKAWFTRGTLLKDLNGGKGVPAGKIAITNSDGKKFTVTLADTDTTVGDVIDKINGTTGLEVTASINANGDGLLLTDTAGGAAGKLEVEESGNGTTAKSLNILGTATATTVDGSWEKTVEFTAADTLTTASQKINELGWGLSAAIINDGSGNTPYRLTLTANNSGRAGRVVFDNGATNLGARTLVEAQDAAVFIGEDGSAQPLLVTSSSNTISGAIRGVTLNLTGVSKEPITLNIAKNVDNIVEAANTFVTNFNDLVDKMKEYTKFDQTTNERGVLLGESAAQDTESEIYAMLNGVVNKDGKYRVAADVGITVGDGGHIAFDEQKFKDAFSDDPEAVTRLFTQGAETLDDDFSLQRLRQNQGIEKRIGNDKPDFRITLRDGTGVDVDVGDALTMGEVLEAMNDALGTKGEASLDKVNNAIIVKDKTTSKGKLLTISDYAGSTVAYNLGISGAARGKFGQASNQFTGKSLLTFNNREIGGIGASIETRINRLIDPVSGQLTREGNNIDERSQQFQDRIDNIDALLAIKRARLEKQFANMESSLAKLQGQQSSLGQIKSIAAA